MEVKKLAINEFILRGIDIKIDPIYVIDAQILYDYFNNKDLIDKINEFQNYIIILFKNNSLEAKLKEDFKNIFIYRYPNKKEDLVKILFSKLQKLKLEKSLLKLKNIEPEDFFIERRKFYSSILKALVQTLESRDPYSVNHSVKVSEIACKIGEKLNLSSYEIFLLELCSLLHDIGKFSVPKNILTKKDRLQENEWMNIRKHPIYSVEILKKFPPLKSLLKPILHHHERYNGSGYPDGLKGEDIPLFSRIISVADVFDAMTTPRAYRPPYTKEYAISEIVKNAGDLYDPNIVKAFLDVLEPENEIFISEMKEKLKSKVNSS